MEFVNKLNNFFFLVDEDETLHPSDAIWFYGGLGVMLLIPIVTFIICTWGNI